MSVLGVAAMLLTITQSDSRDYSLLARRAADSAIAKFTSSPIQSDQLGITVGHLDRQTKSFVHGSFRGDKAMYPASVVKMFFMAYAHRQLEDKKIKTSPEFERAMRDMIVDSSNDATALVVDTVTGTTGGPELSPKALGEWMKKRAMVNRWFDSLGYPALNANQKTWNEAPYGRERQGYGPNFEFRNSLSPDVCARLMSEIAMDQIVSAERCGEMRKLLGRAIPADSDKADGQSRNYTGKILPSGSKLFSKAGWTDTVRHDVAYVVAPDGREFVVAIFTKGLSTNGELIPFIASELFKGLGVIK